MTDYFIGEEKLMSAIAAQPYDYELPTDSKVALVIIDMQRDFLEHGGFGDALGNDVMQLRSIVPTVKKLLETFRSLNLPIIHTIEAHSPDLSDCPPSKLNRGKGNLKIGDQGSMGRILIVGEDGNNPIPELTPKENEIVIVKPGKGAFCRTNLEEILQQEGITHLLITGVTTEVCVQTTMREANDRGYECLLIEDGTASYFPEFKQSTIEMLRAQGGIIGWTANSEAVISALVPQEMAIA
jgi:nicotinamidase-related amidase